MRTPPLVYRDRLDLEAPPAPPGPDGAAVKAYDCDACGRAFEGEPAGSGLYIWARGGEIRYEEPPLCEACAEKVTLGALLAWAREEEEEG